MADFNIQSDSIDVEQIMEQIRSRIRDKRGVDYTEQQIRDLAAVKLERFLDPRGVRSDLLEEFRRMRPQSDPPVRPNYVFDESTLFDTHRAPIRWIRRLLRPLLKLFFNPNPLIQALHIQSQINTLQAEAEAQQLARGPARDQLAFEVMHNLVLETTRMGIEVKNLKMRVESLASRLEFSERRGRALESAVVYSAGRPESAEARPPEVRPQREATSNVSTVSAPTVPAAGGQAPTGPEGPGQRSRRRRRRRGRRGGVPAAVTMGSSSGPSPSPAAGTPDEPGPAADTADPPAASPSSSSGASPSSDPGSGDTDPDAQ